MPALRFDSVSVDYPARGRGDGDLVHAVRGVSLTLPAGGTLGICGESGSGKTTLAMSVLRLLPKKARVTGRILLDDRDVATMTWSQIRAMRWSDAAIVFQGAMHSLNPVRRVGDQIDEALRLHPGETYRRERARAERVRELFDSVDLPAAKIRSYPHELSGGQKQRVMIAMALACAPDIIIADEPTTALDVVVQAEILRLLGALVADHGISLMVITHDLSVLASTCKDLAIMQGGQVVEHGAAAEVMSSPHHQHTRELAAAFPVIGDPRSRLNPVSRHDPPAASAPAVSQPAASQPEPSSERGEPGPVVLSAREVTVRFRGRAGQVTAVREVSLDCRAGEIAALVGQSGSGKTTLARSLIGLQRPDRGQVLYRGEPIGTDVRALRGFRRHVQLILQDPTAALNPRHTVYESVAEGIRIHHLPGDERDLVSQALSRAELNPPEEFFAALPAQLSGGQRQRVVIAGALALEPDFLVADEPVASLDASVRGDILALLLGLKRTLGLGALVITHDLGLAWNVADRVHVMYQGQIVESGPTEDILLHPQHSYTRQLLSVVPRLTEQDRD